MLKGVQMNEEKHNALSDEGHTFCGTPYKFVNGSNKKCPSFMLMVQPYLLNGMIGQIQNQKNLVDVFSMRMPIASNPNAIFGQDEYIFY